MVCDFITLEERLNGRGRQQNEPIDSIHSLSIQSQLTHAYHDHDFADQFGAASSPRDQHYEAPTNDIDVEFVDDGNIVAIEPMTPHYKAPISEGCLSVSMPQAKIEKCVEVDAKDDAGNSSVKVETKKREKKDGTKTRQESCSLQITFRPTMCVRVP